MFIHLSIEAATSDSSVYIYIYIRSVTDFDHDRCYLKSMQCEIDFVCAVDTKTEQDNKVHSVVHISGHGKELTCSVSMPR